MKYTYRALKDDKIVSKTIEAYSENDVIAFLRKNEYMPIEIKKEEQLFPQLNSFFDKVSFVDIVDFTRQLAIMLNAGLTLVDSFAILEKQISKPAMLKVLRSIQKDVMSGVTFSMALRRFPEHFPNLYIALIRSGEASGKLSEILLRLADNLEKQREFQSRVKSALTYPVIILVGMVGIMFVMMTFVMPRLLNLYKDFNIDLPATTKILMAVSSFLALFWPLVVAVVFFAFTLASRYFRTPVGKLILDAFLLKVPVIGHVISISSLVDATRTLSILIGSGVSILDTLAIIIDTSSNLMYRNAFRSILTQVEKGVSLGRAFENEMLFPPILVQMATIGERTGNLDDTMARISKYFEIESEMAVKTMTTLIEPIILVILGVGVGFLVISVITPIYNLTTSFH